MTGRESHAVSDGLSVRCGIVRAGPGGLAEVGLAGPSDELVLLVEVRARPSARADLHELTVELWRGGHLRDRWRRTLGLSPGDVAHTAWRLFWGEGPGSARLRCRVLLDGREVARPGVLLGAPAADAQGRFPQGADARPASEATLLAFAEELDRQIRNGRLSDREI